MTSLRTLGQRVMWGLKSVAWVASLAVRLLFAPSCSGGARVFTDPVARHGYMSRPALNGRVWLMPSLIGGTAGWCMAIANTCQGGGSSSGWGVEVTSAGPV